MAEFAIDGRRIGPGQPVYVIAELSANHHGDLDRARQLVLAAAEAGADAVKLQTYTADTLTIRCQGEHFRIGAGTPWEGELLHDLYRRAQTPWEWYDELAALARSLGMQCFSTPFDDSAVAFLEQRRVPAYKVASFELVDLPLLRRIAGTGKPVILSTGMATLAEIDEAVATVRAAGAPVAVLRTNSGYPADPAEVHLPCIRTLAERFDAVTGLSDHTEGIAVAVAAVGAGACILEKHLTLDRGEPGPDAAFSLEPGEFADLVAAVRVAERAMAPGAFGPTARERASLPLRRSLFVVEDIARGEPLTRGNVRSIRPGAGLHPRHLDEVLGRKAARDLTRGTPLQWDMLEPS